MSRPRLASTGLFSIIRVNSGLDSPIVTSALAARSA